MEVSYSPKCSEPTCFIMSARRVKVLSHHHARHGTHRVSFGRDEGGFAVDCEWHR